MSFWLRPWENFNLNMLERLQLFKMQEFLVWFWE